MKKFNLLFVALIGASALTFTSCTDECKDVVCDNGGTCDEETGACDCPANFYGESCETECINGTYSGGACSCDDGYEGDACGVEQREKFLGSYRSTTDCLSATYASTVGVSILMLLRLFSQTLATVVLQQQLLLLVLHRSLSMEIQLLIALVIT